MMFPSSEAAILNANVTEEEVRFKQSVTLQSADFQVNFKRLRLRYFMLVFIEKQILIESAHLRFQQLGFTQKIAYSID